MISTTIGLEQLKSLNQWVVWKHEYRDRWQKVPYDPVTGSDARTSDPATWGTYDAAIGTLQKPAYDGVGFVFTEDDVYAGVDLDDCFNSETGELEQWAQEIVDALNSYTEISPSGNGVKIWIKGAKPGGRCRKKMDDSGGELEMYDSGRFFTFTGNDFYKNDDIEYRQQELTDLYWRLFPVTEDEEINTVVVEESSGHALDDAALLEKARSNKITGSKFRRLYDEGDTTGYRSDHSRADLALCGLLAFWTAKDPEEVDRLFRGSRLMRDKWNERRGNSTYGELTIEKAIKNCHKVYDPSKYRSEIEKAVNRAWQIVLGDAWSGRSGPTDRDVYKALIYTLGKYGHIEIDDTVTVVASVRDLALRSGLGRIATVHKSLKRLEHKHGLIRRLKQGKGNKASSFTLILTAQKGNITNNCVNTYVPVSRTLSLTRNPSQTYATIGKRNAQLIEYIAGVGKVVTLDELVEFLSTLTTKPRKRDVEDRNIKKLLQRELLFEKDGGYVTPHDLEDRLEREYQMSGQSKAADLQKAKYERERQAQRGRQRNYNNCVNQSAEDVVLQFGYCEDGYLHDKGCPLHLPDLYEETQRAKRVMRMEVAA